MTAALRTLRQVVRADFLERSRRHAFLITLVLALYAAYAFLPPQDSKVTTLDIAGHRGIYNSAWVGCTVALLTSVFFSLIGFYLVRNAVETDRRTGVGQILATTPLTKPLYTLGKAASNFAVLATLALLVALGAIGMQLLRGEDRRVDVVAALVPFLIVTLPALAVTAALAVLFETIRWLRGGFGNVVYFFLFTGAIADAAIRSKHGQGLGDVIGTSAVLPAMIRGVAGAFPGVDPVNPPMNLGFNISREATHLTTFVWDGPTWTVGALASRLGWMAIACAIALLAALPFDRFDTAAAPLRARLRRRRRSVGAAGTAMESVASTPSAPGVRFASSPISAAALAAPARGRSTLVALLHAELTLLVRSVPRAWWLVAAGLAAACWFAPMPLARGWFVVFAWLWPMPMWASLGAREALHRTEGLLFSSPRPLARQLVAAWLAGLLMALTLGAGVGVRLAAAGDAAGAVAWFGGACFIPALALACGTWTGSNRLFEVLYFLLWYLGPANHTPPLDFIGTSTATIVSGAPARFAVMTVALLAVATLGRARRLRG